jgi:MFS transporter, ACS family, tartrate transporter
LSQSIAPADQKSRFAMGYLKDLTGTFTVGLLLLAGCAVIGAAVVVSLRIDAKREQSSGEVALAT